MPCGFEAAAVILLAACVPACLGLGRFMVRVSAVMWASPLVAGSVPGKGAQSRNNMREI